VRSRPDFLLQLTTANVARDLDQVRRALGERAISYFGASWGTLLGAVYRSMFPASVRRMWLDSVVGPRANRLDVRTADTAAATEADFARFAGWLAERNGTYGIGGTADQVEQAVLAMKRALDAEPLVFTDVQQHADGGLVAFLAASPSQFWTQAAEVLRELRSARSGEPAPPAVKQILAPPAPPDGGGAPPADAPELVNGTANQAMLCNDDTGPHDFDSFWRSYQATVRKNPVTGSLGPPFEPCAGWPVPAQPWRLRATPGSLVLSGHRYEAVTPYPWAGELQATIGGRVFTVNDDAHGSVPFVPECAAHLSAYFDTGRPNGNTCQGASAGPPTTEPTPAAAAAAAAFSPRSTRYVWR
jgi:pimeloyl-ACP methyl ester carboxylesterase